MGTAADAMRALTARAHEAHREEMARWHEMQALYRELIPAAYRKRHREARAAARPVERPPTRERPRCGARCRDGHPCVAPVVWNAGEAPRRRCRMHGGLSTGPRTPEGRARSLVAIGQVGAALQRDPTTMRAAEWCADCLTASRRCRGAAAWAQGRAITRDDLVRLVRWTRCERHARPQVAALARATGAITVSLLRPCA